MLDLDVDLADIDLVVDFVDADRDVDLVDVDLCCPWAPEVRLRR